MKLFHIVLAAFVLAGFRPAAAEPKPLGSYQSWDAYTSQDNGQTLCYISAKPTKSEGVYKNRGAVFAEVTHRPAEHHINVFNIIGGYIFKTGAPATLAIGGKTYTLFTHGDAAFAQDADDAKIVAAMRSGDSMMFSGTSTKGTQTKDSFSLKGMDTAYAAIGKACAVATAAAQKGAKKP